MLSEVKWLEERKCLFDLEKRSLVIFVSGNYCSGEIRRVTVLQQLRSEWKVSLMEVRNLVSMFERFVKGKTVLKGAAVLRDVFFLKMSLSITAYRKMLERGDWDKSVREM